MKCNKEYNPSYFCLTNEFLSLVYFEKSKIKNKSTEVPKYPSTGESHLENAIQWISLIQIPFSKSI